MTSERERILLEVFLAVAGPGWEKLLPELLGRVSAEDVAAEASGPVAGLPARRTPAMDVVQRAVTETTGAWREATGESTDEKAAPQPAPSAAEVVKPVAAAARQSGEPKQEAKSSSAWTKVASVPVWQGSQAQLEAQGSSAWSKVASVTSLGTMPLARAIIGLVTGGGKHEPEPLVRFALPPRMRFEAAVANQRMTAVDYDQYGAPRARRSQAAVTEERPQAAASEARVIAPQVTVQVQAMDSRSFMDRSEDIARAVREAMLNMHALNDVVGEL